MPIISGKQRTGSFESRALSELIKFRESQLQGLIIEPLLRSLGFENVRDNSGSREKGKDIVATKRSEFGRSKLYAIQIKKKKFTSRITSKDSLGSLFHQLIQARDEKVVDPTNNVRRSPDECIFITPYPISPNVWESFHVLSQDLYKNNIEVIDGSKLVDLIHHNLPELLEHFSMEVRYRYELERSLNRIPESTIAFGLKSELRLSKIYVDASLHSADKFYERLSKYPILNQGSKVVIVKNTDIRKLNEYGNWFEAKPVITDPPLIKRPSDKNRYIELEKEVRKKPKHKIVQVNLDLTISAIQKKARKSIEYLSTINEALTKENCTKIAIEFIESKENALSFRDFEPVWENWVKFVNDEANPEWSGSDIQLPASVLNKIDCNKFIMGEPGAGKTTLLRKLAKEQLDSSAEVTPIFLPLVLIKEPSKEFLIKGCIKQLEDQGYSLGAGKNAVNKFLNNIEIGSFQLYLDGLDEVGSDALKLLDVISTFVKKYPKLRIVLSCRTTFEIYSFKGALELMLNPFTDVQLYTFINKWFDSQPTLLKNLISWLEKNDKLRKATTNPLIAALLCSIYNLGAEDMPSTETELYERRFDLLLGKWDHAKALRHLNAELTKRYWRFISELAFYMHKREIRIVTMSDANDLASSFFLNDYHDEPSEMVRDCIYRGILEFESTGGLSFGHLTYQEYLVGRKIALDNDNDFLLSKICHRWWKNVARFYAMIKDDISSLIRFAIDSKCNEFVCNELLSLSELTSWTNKLLIEELDTKREYSFGYKDFKDYEYDIIVIKELKKWKSLEEAIKVADNVQRGHENDYDDESWFGYDSDEYSERKAYYDFLIEKLDEK